MDVESLQRSDRRRGSCMDIFLVVSIVFLFVALTVLAAGGLMVFKDLESKANISAHTHDNTGTAQLFQPSPTYKAQNFAYLRVAKSVLRNSTIQLAQISYSTSNSVGSNFQFDEVKHSLEPQREGTYFMYFDLHFTCTHRCKKGVISVQMGEKLHCNVELPEGIAPVKERCWIVSRLNKEGLLAQMTVPKQGMEHWKLELSSGFGIFLVD